MSCKKCQRCDLVYILKDYVKPIMQLLTVDIKEYNMRLLTTKCLNTGLMIMYFMLGKNGIKLASQCDTHVVIKKHKEGIDNNNDVIYNLNNDILSKKHKQRYLYYILLTDGYFSKPDQEDTIFFPGHVFLLEKTPNQDGSYSFQVYQSYINKYDIKGHFENNNNSVTMTYAQVKNLLEKINYILTSNTWDDKCIKYWKDFTFVDTTNLKGTNSKNAFFICYRRATVKTCLGNIKSYIKEKLKILSQMKDKHNIYGDMDKFDLSQNPLNVSQLTTQVQNLLFKINTI